MIPFLFLACSAGWAAFAAHHAIIDSSASVRASDLAFLLVHIAAVVFWVRYIAADRARARRARLLRGAKLYAEAWLAVSYSRAAMDDRDKHHDRWVYFGLGRALERLRTIRSTLP